MSAGWRGSAGQVRRNFRQLSPHRTTGKKFLGRIPTLARARQGSDAGQVARPGQANASRAWSAMKNDENFNMSIRHVEGIRCPGQQGGWLRSKSGCPRCPQWVVESPTAAGGDAQHKWHLCSRSASELETGTSHFWLLPAWSSVWSSAADANCANCAATAATAADCAARKREHRI